MKRRKPSLNAWQKAVNRDGIASAFGTLLVAVRLRAADGDADCLACMTEFHRLRAQMQGVLESKDVYPF